MRRIDLFAEEAGHETVLVPLRLAEYYGVEIKVRRISVRGGCRKVETELREFVKDLLNAKRLLGEALAPFRGGTTAEYPAGC